MLPPFCCEFLSAKDPLGFPRLRGKISAARKGDSGVSRQGPNGVLTSLDALAQGERRHASVISALKDVSPAPFAIRNAKSSAPRWVRVTQSGHPITLYALAGSWYYIAFRFEWVYGRRRFLAVFHDVLITLGLFKIFGLKFADVIAALLTLVGYR